MLPFTPFTAPEHQDFTLSGGEPAALLIHGFPGTPAEMHPLAEALNGLGWTCRGLLLPGFGTQLEALPEKKWTEWRQAALDALASLRCEHSPLVLVGHSMGAAVALSAAARLRVEGMILLAPFWRNRGLLWALIPVLKYFFRRVKPFKLMKTEMDDPRLRTEMQKFLPELDLEDLQTQQTIREFVVPLSMFDELRKVGVAGLRAARKVRCPTLVIQGNLDTTVHPEDSRRLANWLAGNAQWVEVNAGHELPFITSPCYPQVRDTVLAFAQTILVQWETRRKQ